MRDRERNEARRPAPRSLAARAVKALLEADAVVAVRSPSWWRTLPRKLALASLVVLLALAILTWRLGGLTATAAYLLRKETRINVPAADRVRLLAARMLARRDLPPDTLAHLARMAHVLALDDPLRPHVIAALVRATGVAHDPTLAPGQFLARLDVAVARLAGRALDGRGIIDWRPLDPYFVTWLDDLAGASGIERAVERFNGLQPSDGLPTSEWYLDELVNAFDDPRPLPFVLVTSSSGDNWGPLAMAPEAVPSYARRLPARTVGEALRVGLWGFDAYHPGDPGTDPTAWWEGVARQQALPSFSPSAGRSPATTDP